MKRHRPKRLLPYTDLILSIFPVSWAFGRLGCTIAHDHPGKWTTISHWFTVAYGRGPTLDCGLFQLRFGSTPRYDLGYLEFLFTVVVAALFALSWRRGQGLLRRGSASTLRTRQSLNNDPPVARDS